ncbi:hypothetical protein ACJJTC_017012 [Scirpophaga incertulas]
MTMESPVRICFGAALVVNLLLLSSTLVSCNTVPHGTNSTLIKDERNTRYGRVNSTAWLSRHNAKSPDTSLNELNPKDSVSEEHAEKNAKYKDRGRVRYNALAKSTTSNPPRRFKSTTEKPDVIIVTPTPEVKKPAQIIDSMRKYKHKKLPIATSSSTTVSPVSIKTHSVKVESEEDEYEDDDDDDDKSLEKYASSNIFDSNFFTIPNYNDHFSSYSKPKGSGEKGKHDYSDESFGAFSTYFPKESSFDPKENESYKSESFFDFNSDLTTPKNDFFDKKYREISKSIESKLASISTKMPTLNNTNVSKFVNTNMSLDIGNNIKPSNKSTVIIKNTKEIRLLDNENAGSANKELSDVHGTSIYYEMSVLSTETYAINNLNDDDCDNDKLPSEPTVSTSAEEELSSITATQATLIPAAIKPVYPDPLPEKLATLSTNYLPAPSHIQSGVNTANPVPISTQNTIVSTDKSVRLISSSTYTRNRSYSKRLNLSDTKDSPNSVTPRQETATPNLINRQYIRRFHHTTPKTKPMWMAPKRNVTRYNRPSKPTTIYSEHFDIKDKFNTGRPSNHSSQANQNKTILTTVSSDIDPVLQTDIGGVKKIVHSPSISDNTIPSLWKRGSTKFTTSTATSAEHSGANDMEIPPTLTAWALASLRSPPSVASLVVNATAPTYSTHKSIDENELQNVGEVLDKKETSTKLPKPLSTAVLNNDIQVKRVSEIEKNKILWRPVPATMPTVDTTIQPKSTEAKHEKLPAESNISEQSSSDSIQTTDQLPNKSDDVAFNTIKYSKPTWISATEADIVSNTKKQVMLTEAHPTKSNGFESITKLPAGITTPQNEKMVVTEQNIESSEHNNKAVVNTVSNPPSTTDYEVTTIRFSYVPTEPVAEIIEGKGTTAVDDKVSETTTELTWHPVVPTRTVMTTVEDSPITTYRPKYTTTDMVEETTTYVPETPLPIEVSSQIVENYTQNVLETTTQPSLLPIVKTTTTESSTTLKAISTEASTSMKTTTQMHEDTTSIVTEIITEINTERERPKYITTSTTEAMSSDATDCTSEENSDSNDVAQSSTSTTEATTLSKASTSTVFSTPEATTMTEAKTTPKVTTTEAIQQTVSESNANIYETTTLSRESEVESTSDLGTKSVNDLEDLATYGGDVTTEAIPRVSEGEDSGSGAAVAIAVSTIGVIALVLLIVLLLVVRRRGRRGVYAQRCTPVSLDAYSLDSVSVGHRKGVQRLRASKRSYGNPAYDDELQVTSHPMQLAALASFAQDVDAMTAEFAEIPAPAVRPDAVPPGCEDKNRYSNVLPLPDTRVPLRRLAGDPTTEYINANYITGPGNIRNYYIAAQAPLANTVADFWRMVWEQNSRLIVMLTEYMENGVEKCYEYLPPSEVSDNKRTFGEFQVVLKKREQRDKYAVSSVQLGSRASRTWREVTHLWYFWPASGVPDDYDSVIDFLSDMRSYMKLSQTAKEYDEDGVEVIYGEQSRSALNSLSKLREDGGSGGGGARVYSPARAERMLLNDQGTLSLPTLLSEYGNKLMGGGVDTI